MNPNEREELLRRVITGELERDDPAVREGARGDPQFARELEQMLSVVDALERDGVVAQAGAPAAAPQPASPPRRAQWIRAAALAAAIALVLFVARPWRRSGPSGDRDPFLGAGKTECLAPFGDAADFSLFRWRTDAPGVLAKISVWGPGEKDVDHGRVEGANEWRPSPEKLSTYPKDIEWQVEIFDANNQRVGFAEAKASRRK